MGSQLSCEVALMSGDFLKREEKVMSYQILCFVSLLYWRSNIAETDVITCDMYVQNKCT
jgi:hypothetical protein